MHSMEQRISTVYASHHSADRAYSRRLQPENSWVCNKPAGEWTLLNNRETTSVACIMTVLLYVARETSTH